MNSTLQQLIDIHLPRAIQMWPSAPGFIVLYIVAFTLLVYGIYFWYQINKRRHTIKYALRQLNQLQTLSQYNPENINIAAELSTLIRRTALYYFQRDAIAGLSGQEWLKFLNESGQTTQFNDAAGQLLIDAPYRKHNDLNMTPLFALTRDWLTAIAKTATSKTSAKEK